MKSKEVVQRVEGHKEGVCFWVDVCGDTMVSAGQDKTIRVYRNQRQIEEANGKAEDAAEKAEVPAANGVHLPEEMEDLSIRHEDVKMEDA